MSQSEVLFVLRKMKKEYIRKNGNINPGDGFVVERDELERRVKNLENENNLDGFETRFNAYLRKLEKWGYIKRIFGRKNRKGRRKVVKIKVFI